MVGVIVGLRTTVGFDATIDLVVRILLELWSFISSIWVGISVVFKRLEVKKPESAYLPRYAATCW